MAIRSTPVSRCLDRKLQFMGYDMADLLAIFMLLSVLNFLFGQWPGKFWFVWLPSAALAMTLRLAKRDKPEGFLQHWIRFQLRPKAFWAFPEPSIHVWPPFLAMGKGAGPFKPKRWLIM